MIVLSTARLKRLMAYTRNVFVFQWNICAKYNWDLDTKLQVSTPMQIGAKGFQKVKKET